VPDSFSIGVLLHAAHLIREFQEFPLNREGVPSESWRTQGGVRMIFPNFRRYVGRPSQHTTFHLPIEAKSLRWSMAITRLRFDKDNADRQSFHTTARANPTVLDQAQPSEL